jgi:uncharacterized protein (TIGR04255 family)
MRLQNAPLVHVLAQVVFTPVLSMADHIPQIQSGFIELGFPRFRESVGNQLLVGPGGGTSNTVRRSWSFIDRDQSHAFELTDSSLVLQTTAYQSSEPFLKRFLDGLELLAQSAAVGLVERIGMRYIDLIEVQSGERFGDYVHQGLLGFPFGDAPELDATLGGFATQSLATTPLGVLAIRSTLLPAQQVVPADLDAGILRYGKISSDRPRLSVDFDHFSVFSGPDSIDFYPQAILLHMTRLHRTLRKAFDVIATEHAIDMWGPWEEPS